MSAASGRSGNREDALRPVARRNTQKVSHLLAADLRRQILNGQLAADQQLPSEPELVATFEVSRDVLREALRILESQQLVEMRRGRGGGVVVRRPGLEAVSRYVALLLQLRRTTLAHLEEVRTVIEPSAAEEVAKHAQPADLAGLVALHDAERAVEGDPLAFVAAMSAFDQAVTELSANPALAVLAGVFRDIYAGQVYSTIGGAGAGTAEPVARRVIVSHSAFLDAVRRHDTELARQAWSDYLFTTGRLLVTRTVSRRPIDITPLWRAQAGSEPAPRRALVVAAEIRARIAEGRLGEGDRLPGLPELAAEFGISRPTLREALRILEMEFLLDLRTGDRAGATVRAPSTRVAAQLAGTVLQARHTTVADTYPVVRAIEPAIVGLVAARVNARQLGALRAVGGELAAVVEDSARFVPAWWEAMRIMFSAVRNPALTVIAEILHFIETAVEPEAITGPAANQAAQRFFARFVAAAAEHDSAAASRVWVEYVQANGEWVADSELGKVLLTDLLD